MRVTVVHVAYDGGSTAIGVGLNEVGDVVRFAGDYRPMQVIAAGIESGEDVEVELEAWQIMSVVRSRNAVLEFGTYEGPGAS